MADDNSDIIPISYRRNTERFLEPFSNLKNTTIMKKIIPIDIIKGFSDKFCGSNSKENFATNKCSSAYFPYRSPFELRSTSVQPPFVLRSTSVRAPFNLRSSSVQPPFELRSTSVRAPFILRSTSVRAPFNLRSSSVQPPFELRSSSVDSPFVLRSSSVRRSKNERRIIEEISENHRRQDGDVSKL